MQTMDVSTKRHVLHFKILTTAACLDIQYLVKVLPLMQLEKIPLSAGYIVGLMNIHGVSIPVIDLALFLAMKRKNPYTLDSTILHCKYKNLEFALLVDSAQQLSSLSEADLQNPATIDTQNSAFLAINNENNQQSFLLNMEKIYNELQKHMSGLRHE